MFQKIRHELDKVWGAFWW